MTRATPSRPVRTAIAALIVLLLVIGVPAPALAQSGADPGVGELWKEYPLEEGSATATPATPATPEATRAPAAAPPADRAPAEDTGGGLPWSPLLVAALALGATLLGFRLARLRRGRPTPARTERRDRDRKAEPAVPTYAEGVADRDGIGAFGGVVRYAQTHGGPDSERMLLVQDAERDAPIWVKRSEITATRRFERRAEQPVARSTG